MAAKTEINLLPRLGGIFPIAKSVLSSSAENPADKDNSDSSLSPIQGSQLVDLSSSTASPKWREISQLKPGSKRLILIPVSPADAKLILEETKPATEAPAGDEALKLICEQLHEVVGYDALVYEIPLNQNEGPVSPQEVEQFVSLTKIAESGTPHNSKYPLSYYIEEQSFESEPEVQTNGLIPMQSIARRAQALINGGPIPKRRAVNIWAVVGRPQTIETPVPPIFQNEFQNAPAAALDPTVTPTNPIFEPGKWVPLGPVNQADIGKN